MLQNTKVHESICVCVCVTSAPLGDYRLQEGLSNVCIEPGTQWGPSTAWAEHEDDGAALE